MFILWVVPSSIWMIGPIESRRPVTVPVWPSTETTRIPAFASACFEPPPTPARCSERARGLKRKFLAVCEFLDGSSVLLPYELIATCESIEATEAWNLADAVGGGPRYVGVDFGRQNDPTVIWTLQRVGGLLVTREVRVLRGVSSPDQQRILSPIIKDAVRTSFDYTGPGIGLGDYIAKEHGDYKPEAHKFGKVDLCTFTPGLKRSIFPRLRQAFERKEVLIPISREVREDLHEMQQVTSGGEYSYHSRRTKEGHSDRCTALALALRAAGTGGGPAMLPKTFKTRLAAALARRRDRSVMG